MMEARKRGSDKDVGLGDGGDEGVCMSGGGRKEDFVDERRK